MRFALRQGDGAPAGSRDFRCTLQCATCGAPTRRGAPCAKRACYGVPVCWMHARSVYGVEAGPSRVANAGMGLFAERHFAGGDWIVPYHGEALTSAAMDQRYGRDGEAPYGLCRPAGKQPRCVDAACVRGWAAFANHGAAGAANAEYEWRRAAPRQDRPAGFWIRASAGIRKGDEILVDYGPSYSFASTHATR